MADIKLNEAEAKTTLSDADGILVADETARAGDQGAAASNPKYIRYDSLKAQIDVPTDSEINALADERVRAGVADWAEDGNTDLIPDSKLPEISGGGSGDDAFDWATEGNSDNIPDSKLGNVQPVALVSNQERWGTNKLPTNIAYHHTTYSASATYNPGVTVLHNDILWKVKATTAVTGSEPADDNDDWAKIDGVGPQGPQGPQGPIAPGNPNPGILLGTLTWTDQDNPGDGEFGFSENFFLPATAWADYHFIWLTWEQSDTVFNPRFGIPNNASEVLGNLEVLLTPFIRTARIGESAQSDTLQNLFGSSLHPQTVVWQNGNFPCTEILGDGRDNPTSIEYSITDRHVNVCFARAQTNSANRLRVSLDNSTVSELGFPPLSGSNSILKIYRPLGPGQLKVYGTNVGSSGGTIGDDAFAWATEGNTDKIPDSKIPDGIARDSELPTAPATWAEDGNTDPIPSAKLPPVQDGGSGDDAFDWATVGNTDLVPDAKLPVIPRQRGIWAAGIAYNTLDVVQIESSQDNVYLAVVAHTSTAQNAPYLVAGGPLWLPLDQWLSLWRDDRNYAIGQVVRHDSRCWMAIDRSGPNTGNAAQEPSATASRWRQIDFRASDIAAQALAGNTTRWADSKMSLGSFINRGNWNSTNIYLQNNIVRHSDLYWVSLTSNNQNNEPADSSTHWRKFAGPKGDKGDKGDQGDAGDDGAPGAAGPAGPAGTVPNQAGVPVGWQSLGTPVALSATQLVLNATAWQTYDFLSIMIRETSAPSVSYTGLSFLPVEELKLKTPTDASVSDSSASALADRGNYLQSTNRQFYVGRRITDGDNKLRWATNSTIGGPNRELEVFGIRVGYGSFKGAWVNSATYARGDYVYHSSEFWFVTAETISNSEPTDSNTNYKKLGSGTGGGGDANNYLNALRPPDGTNLTNIRTATVGVHNVVPATEHKPAGVTVGANEASLHVFGSQSGSSSEHKWKLLSIINDDPGATQRRLYLQFQDGPGSQAASHSPWYRLDDRITNPGLVFDSDNNELDITYTDGAGASQTASVAIPAKFRGRVDSVELSWSGYNIIATMKNAAGATIGTNQALIPFPAHNRNQWVDGSRTGATIISPQELGRFLADAAPVAAAPQETSEANTTAYRWTPQRVGNRAKNALPAVTVASATTGTSTAQKTVTDAVLKTLLENHTGDAGGIRELGERTVTTMGADRLVIPATGFTDYTAIIVEIEVGGDSRASEMIPVEFLTRDGLAVYTDGNVRTVGNTHYARASTTGGVPVQLNIARATTATSSPWTVSDNHIAIGTSTTFTNPTIRIWGVRLGAGSGESGGGSGGGGGAGGLPLIGQARAVGSGQWGGWFTVPAAAWNTYDAILITADSSTSDSDSSFFNLGGAVVRTGDISNTAVFDSSGTRRAGNFPDAIYAAIGTNTGSASYLSLYRNTQASSAPWTPSNDHIVISSSIAGEPNSQRFSVYGMNFGGGSGGGGASPTFISYAHKNAPNQDEGYAPSVVYGGATDSRVTDETARRKFEVGDVLSSSNSNNGLPSATLEFKTGARGGVDRNEGETAAGNLLDGTVFTPGSGTWKITGDITIDNLDDADQRIVMELWEVVTTGTDDDKILWAEASEGAGAAGENHATTTPTATDLHNFALTARMETPPLQFDGVKSYYLTWRLTGGDDDGAWRIRNATLSMSKEA